MGNKAMPLKESVQLTIFVKRELLKRIDAYWHKSGMPNRSRTISHLIEKALEREKPENNARKP